MTQSRSPQKLSERDLDLLHTLLERVRFLTLEQVARTWWPHTTEPRRNTYRRLLALEHVGLVELVRVASRPEFEISAPLFRWDPGRSMPDFGPIEGELARRSAGAPRATRGVIASQSAERRFGGKGGRLSAPLEQAHDQHLASVYLFFREFDPPRAKAWKHEDGISRGADEKRPDAYTRDGTRTVAIEIAGRYRSEKLKLFHEHCSERGLPYELW